MNGLILTVLILPGVVVAYFFYLRPIWHAMPMFKRFYARADGFWQTLWALFGKSATMVWAAILQGLGLLWGHVAEGIAWALQWLDPIANFLGDPDFQAQVSNALEANPKLLGWVLMVISLITIATRLRGMMAQSTDQGEAQ